VTLNESELLEATDERDLKVVTVAVEVFLKKLARDFDYPMARAVEAVRAAIKKLGY
jgi:hypothetical protein